MNQIEDFFKLNPIDPQIFYCGYFLEPESDKEFCIEVYKVVEYLANLPFLEQYYVYKSLCFLSNYENSLIIHYLETFVIAAICEIVKNPEKHANYTLQIINRKA